jgi:hypothetical protein
MENPQYKFKSAASSMSFEFVSEGMKGRITKLVKYTKYGDSGVYTLAFGDKIGNSNKIDDKVISDNGDGEKVLATVAATVFEFMEAYPKASVFARGSNLVRTRLYRIRLSNILDEINDEFEVLGFFEGDWEIFERNRDYSAFLITKR